jgi:hypothetical protein
MVQEQRRPSSARAGEGALLTLLLVVHSAGFSSLYEDEHCQVTEVECRVWMSHLIYIALTHSLLVERMASSNYGHFGRQWPADVQAEKLSLVPSRQCSTHRSVA